MLCWVTSYTHVHPCTKKRKEIYYCLSYLNQVRKTNHVMLMSQKQDTRGLTLVYKQMVIL